MHCEKTVKISIDLTTIYIFDDLVKGAKPG